MNLISRKTKYLAIGSWSLFIAAVFLFFVESSWWSPLLLGGAVMRITLPQKNFQPEKKHDLSHWLLIGGVFMLALWTLESPQINKILSVYSKIFFGLWADRFSPFFIGGVTCLMLRAIVIDFKYLSCVPTKDIERYYKLNHAEQEPAPNP